MTWFPRPALVLAAVLTVTAPAFAQTAAKPGANAAPKTAPKVASAGGITRAKMQAAAHRAFVAGDTDKDGFISRKEFAARLTALLNRTPPGTKGAPTAAQAKQLVALAQASFNAADINHDGKLSPAEAGKQQMVIFDRMDTNHDGVLSPAERAAGAQMRATELGR